MKFEAPHGEYGEYDKKEAKFWKKALNIREDIALQRIEDKGKYLKQKIMLLIYGKGHEFKDNVLKYNEMHPDKKIGLIKFVPNEPDGMKK